MTSERKALLLALPLAALAAAGCGNYSNEDLEFMNALPEGDDLRVAIPARSTALSAADEAELAKMTHDTTRGFNGLLGSLVSIVDLVRSLPPTSRTPDSRTWGPFEPERQKLRNRDWWTRMIMRRNLDNPDQFDYEISVHKLGNGDLDWPVFIRGWFQAGQTARRGHGHVELVTAAVRAEGMDLTELERLDHLEIDYDTLIDPVSVDMTITWLPPLVSADPPPMVVYAYKATAAGRGQMTFDIYADLVVVTPGIIEHTNVTSRWLPGGEGRATLTVVSGDGAGSIQTECWDASFTATYNDKPWMMGENHGTDPSVCLDIPPL